MNRDLADAGLEGEGIVDDSVWIIKTHYPEWCGFGKFEANKCLMVVRSPIDAVVSLWNMIGTSTHDKSIHPEDFGKFPELFELFTTNEITVWRDFHKWWLDKHIPTYIMRFEDLLSKPKEILTNVFRFLLSADDISGTVIEALIAKATYTGEAPQLYKPRSGGINKNI